MKHVNIRAATQACSHTSLLIWFLPVPVQVFHHRLDIVNPSCHRVCNPALVITLIKPEATSQRTSADQSVRRKQALYESTVLRFVCIGSNDGGDTEHNATARRSYAMRKTEPGPAIEQSGRSSDPTRCTRDTLRTAIGRQPRTAADGPSTGTWPGGKWQGCADACCSFRGRTTGAGLPITAKGFVTLPTESLICLVPLDWCMWHRTLMGMHACWLLLPSTRSASLL